ncbi:MAG: thioredoxin domain-containing protein [Myxococcales bacterium]|nr:thioredoxin domain-containing protein [Myxococcales bacterium]
MGPGYTPRTRHLTSDHRPRYTNRLLLTTSPYLLQHAHNPVDWFPWSEEAFLLAEQLDRPVFLSIGYSTCHWCHVMEHESFEDEQIASVMNSRYICIKLDREERPDIDAVYMRAVQLATGHGGWPMSVWLFPDKKPFYSGTYFPAYDGQRGARMGFLSLLNRLADLFSTDRVRVIQAASHLTNEIRNSFQGTNDTPNKQHEASPDDVARLLLRQADYQWGGFGHAPKFPVPSQLDLVLRYGWKHDDAETKRFVELTLDKMAQGGIYDHLAGGFARYSTDSQWLVPHFEKMLYDNAQLVCTYLDAFQWTQNPTYAEVATDILDYLTREMSHPSGGFYSATDADSEGEEGRFFVWTIPEVVSAVGEEKAAIINTVYGMSEHGNWEGTNILTRWTPLSVASQHLGLSEHETKKRLGEAKSALYEARKQRVPPSLDDKVLLAWNGLAIRAFARAGWVLNNGEYTQRAIVAANFMLAELGHNGRLYRVWRNGQAHVDAMLEDYAFFVSGLIELVEVTGDSRWLDEAIRLQQIVDTRFRDVDGCYFMTADDHESLLAREKPAYDGAEPCGNSVVCENLVRLGLLTDRVEYLDNARRTIDRVLAIANHPTAVPRLLTVLEWLNTAQREVAVVVTDDHDANAALLNGLAQCFDPYRVFTVVHHSQVDMTAQAIPWIKGKTAIGGKPTAYVCSGMNCQLPARDVTLFVAQLSRSSD